MKLLLAGKVKAAIAMSNPRVVEDFDTKAPKHDEATGAPLYSVQVALVVEGDRPEVIKVVGPIKGEFAEGDTLALDGIAANFWTMNGKSGLSLRAQTIRKAA
jgi:hypothetical protein